jgi:AhpD family alkylhydroperoxidase
MTQKNYSQYIEHLKGRIGSLSKEIPGSLTGFSHLHREATVPGTLDTKTKELIAVSVAIAVHCVGCISYHVHGALAAHATREEIIETVGLSVLMGGGPSLMYGAEALEALNEFQGASLATGSVGLRPSTRPRLRVPR